MCEWGDTVDVEVTMPADLSHTGKQRKAVKAIDRCIAPIVDALNRGGVVTRSSCCGHKKGPGSIVLEDGRTMLVINSDEVDRYVKHVDVTEERPTPPLGKAGTSR